MKPIYALVTAALVCSGIAASAETATAETKRLRRFALVVGANNGGKARVKLRYAGTDARSFAKVVTQLGGVAAADVSVLIDPSTGQLDAGFSRLKRRLAGARAQKVRVELIVYYSGHSDEQGLLLAGQRYRYDRLRKQVRAMPADVNIAILDSCASGAFTRTKGGKRRPPFLVDASNRVRGHAFLSSSSADEDAQESDRIRASFFTHYLLSGLRGGADANRDKVVTLSEAYQFAYRETVSRTRSTKHGVQHPAYDMHLAGTGDVVMTDLRATDARLILARDISGRVFVNDSSQRLIVELRKAAGTPVVLGLGPGAYRLVLHRGSRKYKTGVRLTRGRQTRLSLANFTRFRAEPAVARGGTAEARGKYPRRAVNLSFFPGVSTGGTSSFRHQHQFSFNIIAGGGAALNGIELGGLVNLRRDWVRGAQVAGIANVTGGWVRGAQIAGIANITAGEVRGTQVAGIANLTGGDARALQIAGIGNHIGGNSRGPQIAGIGNWVEGRVRGTQIAGLANVAGDDVRGTQVAGVINVAGGDVRGAQIGLINVGGDVDGAQVGLINIASSVRGAQIGLINVAQRNDGVPLGLVNAFAEGHRAGEVWTSDVIPLSIGFKFGSRSVYSLFAVGASDDLFFAGAGIGAHVDRADYYIDVDIASYSILEHDFGTGSWDQLAQLRAMVGFRVAQGLSLFAGAQLSALVNYDNTPGDDLLWLKSSSYHPGSALVRLAPGFFAGVSY